MNKYIIKTIIGSILISFSGVLVKLSDIKANVSGFYRVFTGFIFILLYVIIFRKKIILSTKTILFLLIASLMFFFDLTVWHQSIIYVGPGIATILANFQVFFMALYGYLFLKEKLNIFYFISLPLAITGLFLISYKASNTFDTFNIGIILGLLTSVFYTFYLIFLRKAQESSKESGIISVFWISLFSSLFFFIDLLRVDINVLRISTKSLILMSIYGLTSQVIAWALISSSIKHIKSSQTGLILLIQPALSFLWDILFFKSIVSLVNIAGCIITVLAIYLGLISKED